MILILSACLYVCPITRNRQLPQVSVFFLNKLFQFLFKDSKSQRTSQLHDRLKKLQKPKLCFYVLTFVERPIMAIYKG